jgi:flagellar biosynthetic protein FliQ
MPAVFLAAGIGLVVGIIQAVTQVQEQTIAAAPKIIGVFLLLIFTGGLMLQTFQDYTREAFHLAFTEIPQMDAHLLPPHSPSEREQRLKDFFQQPPGFDSTAGKSRAGAAMPPDDAERRNPDQVPLRPGPSNQRPNIVDQLRQQRGSNGNAPQQP